MIGEVAPDGVWLHGVSLHGWKARADGGFLTRHPQLRHGRGTIRLRVDDSYPDDDLRLPLRAVLGQ